MKRLRGFAPLVGVALAASSAQAGTFLVRDAIGGEGVLGQSDAFYLTGTAISPSGTVFGSPLVNLPMGTFDFEIDFTGTGSSFESFRTYCAEPTQEIDFDDNPPDTMGHAYTLEPIGNLAGLTATEIERLSILYANAFGDAQTSNIKAGAFQIIIWELVRDDDFNVTSGLTRLSTTNALSMQITAQANAWWDNIIDGVWTKTTTLGLLASPDSQDLIIDLAPTPGAAVVGGLGVMMFSARRRRSA